MKSKADKPEKWREITAVIDRGTLEQVVPLFDKYGYGGAILEEWPDDAGSSRFTVRIYLPFSRQGARKKDRLLDAIKSTGRELKLEERLLEPGVWLNEWKKFFEPFAIGEKLIIRPEWWDRPLECRGRQIIELDPGMAFGTGLHATTRLTCLALEKYLKAGMSVLDLGTGSGILAIAAAKLGAGPVLALDIDPVAVAAATFNVRKNKLEKTVAVKKGTLNAAAARRWENRFDLIAANITADVIIGLAPFFLKVLKPGAILVAGGINQPGLDRVLIALSLAGLQIQAISAESDWHSVVARRNL